MKSFGATLKQFRIARGLTLRDLAKLSDTDHAYIYRLETGAKTRPSKLLLKALIKAMRLDQHESAKLTNALIRELIKTYGGMIS